MKGRDRGHTCNVQDFFFCGLECASFLPLKGMRTMSFRIPVCVHLPVQCRRYRKLLTICGGSCPAGTTPLVAGQPKRPRSRKGANVRATSTHTVYQQLTTFFTSADWCWAVGMHAGWEGRGNSASLDRPTGRSALNHIPLLKKRTLN